ncbi:hypothetical protein FCN18_33405 [Prauserella endophytica]|uniref:Plasmid mobilization relaxosome protein MobC n=2 Tax=Prauserella endophytica TaxID=1592324 RepID=A0ABY2RW40_9PSEU|nr:hypothetical protein [Prauserella endophytica]TKG61538.1 hypothetical protein FCN18_33405 [Prauserella endophytica]
MTDEELLYIEAAATAAGLSVPSFLVASAMTARAAPGMSVAQREGLAAEILGVSRLLRRTADNLNRLTRIAQSQDSLPHEVPAAAAAVRRYVETFAGIVAELDPRRNGTR